MSSDFSQEQNPHYEEYEQAPEPPDDESGQGLEKSFLDDVLNATMSSDDALHQINQRTHNEFLMIARQYQGQRFQMNSMGIALVRAVLSNTLNENLVSLELQKQLAAQIAETLSDNPTARTRLEAFWIKLQEAVT